jgi:hypothetical protein
LNYRNRDLLDLAYELECTLRIDGVCVGGIGEPCHSNQSIHGKGGALKAHDCFFASGCRPCHRELDQGHQFTREEKAAIWNRAYIETTRQLWDGGYLQVTAPSKRLSA